MGAVPVLIVSVLHQNEGGIGKSIPVAQEISRDPRDVLGAQPEGHLEGRGKSRGQRGGFPNNSRFLGEYGHSIHHQGVHGIIIPEDREGLTVLNPILPYEDRMGNPSTMQRDFPTPEKCPERHLKGRGG